MINACIAHLKYYLLQPKEGTDFVSEISAHIILNYSTSKLTIHKTSNIRNN